MAILVNKNNAKNLKNDVPMQAHGYSPEIHHYYYVAVILRAVICIILLWFLNSNKYKGKQWAAKIGWM